ncbi:MAG TPA: peptidyl-prolyl cis-trans isomerase [Caulobacteraceae bacterium]|nr:peptidyl-prolyl cis-trans isomerase [Caulobacteraceae bacterium]
MSLASAIRLPLFGVLIAGALALCACSQKHALERAPEPGDKAVATVDGQSVWASDVKREAVAQGLIGEGEPLDISSDAFRQMLDEVIDEKLLAAQAIKQKLDKDPVAQRRLAAAKDQILGNMLVQSVVDRAVSDQAIQTLYQEQLNRSKLADEIHARQIVVATPADAEAIKKQLASGASFESLAIEKSLDQATRFNGGDLGYFTTDVMPGAYEAALKDAKTGEIVGPVKVDNGFAVIKVEDRRPEQPIALEQARPQIVRFLTYNQVRDLLKRLRDQSKVKVLIGPPTDVPGAPTEPASAPTQALTTPPSSAPPDSRPGPAAKIGSATE